MTTSQNPFADLSAFVYRSQSAAADAFETWAGIAQAVTEATGSQTKNLRQILHGLFDLVDQAFTVEREIATYLTIASRVSATAADSCRELTDIALATVETAAAAVARAR
jgi:DNA topoisomerase IB